MSITNTDLLKNQYLLAVMIAAIVLTFYQVFVVQSPLLRSLKKDHEMGLSCTKDAFCGAPGYASRLIQCAEGGIGTNPDDATCWGNPLGTCSGTSPGTGQGNESGDPNVSGFISGREPPIFYDIGDVTATRNLRTSGGYTVQPDGTVIGTGQTNWNAADQYGRKFYREEYVDPAGVRRKRWVMRGTYCGKNPDNPDCAKFMAARVAKQEANASGWVQGDDGNWVRTTGKSAGAVFGKVDSAHQYGTASGNQHVGTGDSFYGGDISMLEGMTNNNNPVPIYAAAAINESMYSDPKRLLMDA